MLLIFKEQLFLWLQYLKWKQSLNYQLSKKIYSSQTIQLKILNIDDQDLNLNCLYGEVCSACLCDEHRDWF